MNILNDKAIEFLLKETYRKESEQKLKELNASGVLTNMYLETRYQKWLLEREIITQDEFNLLQIKVLEKDEW